MKRWLLLASKAGYQTEALRCAAAALRVRLELATNRRHLADPWRDGALAVDFEPQDWDGNTAVGDQATAVGATLAERYNSPACYAGAVRDGDQLKHLPLLLSSKAGCQTGTFRCAAAALRVRPELATNRCHHLKDLRHDRALAVYVERPELAPHAWEVITAATTRTPGLGSRYHSPAVLAPFPVEIN